MACEKLCWNWRVVPDRRGCSAGSSAAAGSAVSPAHNHHAARLQSGAVQASGCMEHSQSQTGLADRCLESEKACMDLSSHLRISASEPANSCVRE